MVRLRLEFFVLLFLALFLTGCVSQTIVGKATDESYANLCNLDFCDQEFYHAFNWEGDLFKSLTGPHISCTTETSDDCWCPAESEEVNVFFADRADLMLCNDDGTPVPECETE